MRIITLLALSFLLVLGLGCPKASSNTSGDQEPDTTEEEPDDGTDTPVPDGTEEVPPDGSPRPPGRPR